MPLTRACSGALDLDELLEDPLLVRARDADAGVSDRERDLVSGRLHRRRDPDLAALGELQRVRDEVAQDLRHLRLVGAKARQTLGLLEDEAHGVAHQERAQHAAEGAEQVGDLEGRSDGRRSCRPRPSRGRGDRPTSSDRSCAALRMKPTCRSCSAVSSPSIRPSRSRLSARIEFSGVRNSWLMFERKRDFISSARRRWSARSSSSAYSATTPRLVSSSSRLSATSSSCRVRSSSSAAQQLLVLPLELRERIVRSLLGELPAQPVEGAGVRTGVPARQELPEPDRRALRRRVDVESIHQPARADHPEAHAGRRSVLVPRGSGRAPDAGAPVRYPDQEDLGRGTALEHELDLATLGVLEGVAGDLGHRGRDTRLVLHVEAEEPAICRRALPRQHHVALAADRRPTGGSGSCGRPARHHDRRVVAAAAKVAVQDAGDQHGMAPDQAGIGVEGPVRARARRSAAPAWSRRPGVRELLEPSDLVAQRSRGATRASAGVAAEDRSPAMFPTPANGRRSRRAVDVGDRHRGPARRAQRLVEALEHLGGQSCSRSARKRRRGF